MIDTEEELPEKLQYPKVPAKTLRSLGAFIIAWGTLEGELDVSFPVLFRLNPTLCTCITANLGTKAKLDALASAVSMLSECLGEELTESAHEALNEIREYSGIARNTIAHGQPLFFSEADEPKRWVFARYSARKKLDMAIYPVTAEHWDDLAKYVRHLAETWRMIASACHDLLNPLGPKDFDRICGYGGTLYGQP